ncbi:MAG: CYTH and CHAD domain-containing protein [Sulfuriferula sp.]
MTVEIELKLALQPEQIARLKRHPLLSDADTPLRRRLVSVYFDTPALELMQARAALRVRRVGKNRVQTVKIGGGSAGGLHQRPEWETSLAGVVPEPERFDAPVVKALLTPDLVARLSPVFETRLWRTTWTLPIRGGGSIEVALDQGEVIGAGRSMPVCEVELELKSGQPAVLYDLALALAVDFDLRPDPLSKAERGYALFRNLQSQPVHAASVGLKPKMRVTDAFVAVMQSALEQFTANLAGLIHEADPEYLHQARVAVRRLLAALTVFSHVLSGRVPMQLRQELHWLMGALGPARDWDVFVTQTLPPLMATIPGQPLASLNRDSEAHRGTARAAMMMEITSRRLSRMLLEIGRMLWRRPWEKTTDRIGTIRQKAPTKAFAESALNRRKRWLLQRGRHIASLSPEARHGLRIAAKKQRYAAEFFAELYAPKAVQAYIKKLAVLQDYLGALNDIAVAKRLLDELRCSRTVNRAMACGMVQGWVESHARAQVTELQPVWRRMKKTHPFWRKQI